MKEAADSLPSSDTKLSPEWESIHVAYIASGDPQEDRRLANLARAKGQVVFLKDLPDFQGLLLGNDSFYCQLIIQKIL